MNVFTSTCQTVPSTLVHFDIRVSVHVEVRNLSEASTAGNWVYSERTLRIYRRYNLRQK
jgi:hypothetical protein